MPKEPIEHLPAYHVIIVPGKPVATIRKRGRSGPDEITAKTYRVLIRFKSKTLLWSENYTNKHHAFNLAGEFAHYLAPNSTTTLVVFDTVEITQKLKEKLREEKGIHRIIVIPQTDKRVKGILND